MGRDAICTPLLDYRQPFAEHRGFPQLLRVEHFICEFTDARAVELTDHKSQLKAELV